jgi:AcrR family transcriptional regulator
MSPRPYKMERRQAAADQTRVRILQAARKLLLSPDFREFTMESVAKGADVSRLTVYYQFHTKAGLLEALYNYIAKNGDLGRLPEVFRLGNEPRQRLHNFIEVFVDFWASDRDVIRRLHALGAIDAEIGRGLRARNERRRNGLRVLLEDYNRMYYRFMPSQEPIMLDTLHMLTSFETYDALAVPGRTVEDVFKAVRKMADQAIGMWPPPISPFTAPMPVKPERKRRRSRS